MCGIYGIWHTDGRPADLGALRRATDRLRHRGPDDEGYLLAETRAGSAALLAGPESDPRLGLAPLEAAPPGADLALGFRRLAILDLSPAGHQPMATPDGRYWIVFNGEVYNYVELREELRALGHAFRSGADTEVILAAYAAWGPACLERLNGMWAFAIWDRRERSLFLARDRFGVKPLYYTWEAGTLAFASEIKPLVGRGALPFRPDDGAVYRFLEGGALPSAQAGDTFFQGVRSLPPAHAMLVRGGALELRRYWDLELPPPDAPPADEARLIEAYRALFFDAVRLQLRSDVAVGTCLSGGVDSSSIVCVVNRLMGEQGLSAAQIGERQKTFSAVYTTEGRYNERRFIEKVLRATGADGTMAYPTAEGLLADIERLAWHQDEPYQSTSIFAQWCVMRAVRERGVTVLLDGQGADEVLAGYRPFGYFLADLARAGRVGEVAAEALCIRERTGLAPAALARGALLFAAPAPVRAAARRAIQARNGEAPVVRAELAAHAARGGARVPPRGGALLDRHLREAVLETSLPTLLRYEDRSSMAFSVEARVPFLDHRLVEFSFREAARLRIHRGWTKYVHRRAMVGVLPGAIAWRTDKVGFETPEVEWQRRLLRERPDLLADDALSAAYLDMPAARQAAARWAERGGDARRVWRWVSLETWLRAWAGA